MKDATGELSMTAVAVVAIAAISVLFSTLIWPTIRTNIMRSTYCSGATNCQCNGGDMCSCQYCPSQNGTEFSGTCEQWEEIECSRNDINA